MPTNPTTPRENKRCEDDICYYQAHLRQLLDIPAIACYKQQLKRCTFRAESGFSVIINYKLNRYKYFDYLRSLWLQRYIDYKRQGDCLVIFPLFLQSASVRFHYLSLFRLSFHFYYIHHSLFPSPPREMKRAIEC